MSISCAWLKAKNSGKTSSPPFFVVLATELSCQLGYTQSHTALAVLLVGSLAGYPIAFHTLLSTVRAIHTLNLPRQKFFL
ncbi:hypothetical protein BDV27DRAFT_136527 [Aspergillus caelatus]|uniref:Uncharacterized protein n=1 Tax=Aspergillus caelatus TaxID=61420 RepID=A0A5N6ZPA5_9EURO|nr:uncharacterized protein BDV27DRAFT_136527 [Aspergillus caelatus]KAE8359208.1 hypothetical protein BDV27DRAFT_136527 [Aspergillus caelatus]